MGNRVMKKVINSSGTSITYYIRDAQGNVLSTYKKLENNDINLQDFTIYGSSRLGILNINQKLINLPQQNSEEPVQTKIGIKYFELSNHLGNVLSTISDRKIEHGSGSTVEYYTADIISATDYYPFGFAMDERNFSSSEYRFGFNGQEKDDEFTNSTSHYDFGARIYDSRLGRWLAVDPLAKEYPDFSTYCFVDNKPIIAIDPNGKEIWVVIGGESYQYSPETGVVNAENLSDEQMQVVNDFHSAVLYNMNTDIGTEIWEQLDKSEGVVKVNLIADDSEYEFGDNIGDLNGFTGGGINTVTSESGEEKRFIGQIDWEVYGDMFVLEKDGDLVANGMPTSTSLLHEAGHAQRYDNAQQGINGDNLIELNKDLEKTSKNKYDFRDAEEERNITEVENEYVRQINKWEKEKGTGQVQSERHDSRFSSKMYKSLNPEPIVKRSPNEKPPLP